MQQFKISRVNSIKCNPASIFLTLFESRVGQLQDEVERETCPPSLWSGAGGRKLTEENFRGTRQPNRSSSDRISEGVLFLVHSFGEAKE